MDCHQELRLEEPTQFHISSDICYDLFMQIVIGLIVQAEAPVRVETPPNNFNYCI